MILSAPHPIPRPPHHHSCRRETLDSLNSRCTAELSTVILRRNRNRRRIAPRHLRRKARPANRCHRQQTSAVTKPITSVIRSSVPCSNPLVALTTEHLAPQMRRHLPETISGNAATASRSPQSPLRSSASFRFASHSPYRASESTAPGRNAAFVRSFLNRLPHFLLMCPQRDLMPLLAPQHNRERRPPCACSDDCDPAHECRIQIAVHVPAPHPPDILMMFQNNQQRSRCHQKHGLAAPPSQQRQRRQASRRNNRHQGHQPKRRRQRHKMASVSRIAFGVSNATIPTPSPRPFLHGTQPNRGKCVLATAASAATNGENIVAPRKILETSNHRRRPLPARRAPASPLPSRGETSVPHS